MTIMKNLRILLVNPPHTGRIIFPGINDRIAFRMHDYAPPLGLLYIKSYLETHTRARVNWFNFQTPLRPSLKQFADHLQQFKPNLAGITVLSPFWYGTCLITDLIKKKSPDTVIVGGGPHMWTYPEETMSRGHFDVIVQGQGEKPFHEIARRLTRSEDLYGIPGTICRRNDRFIRTPPAPLDKAALDDLPFPDRSLLDIGQHRFSVNRHNPCALMVASRGCPYNCSFCNNRERFFIPRDPGRIAAEMRECARLGYRSIQFCDDVFTHSRRHTLEICQQMASLDIVLPWSCQTRVDCVDPELIAAMRQAGCERLQFGIESANPGTLERINKKILPDQISRAVALCKKQDIITVGNFIIGFPWETETDIQHTFDFMFALDADYVFCNPLIPFPGTRIYNEAATDPEYDKDWFKKFFQSPAPDARIPLWTNHVSEEKICDLIKKFYRQYYFNWRRMRRHLSNTSGFRDIITKSATGIKLIIYK